MSECFKGGTKEKRVTDFIPLVNELMRASYRLEPVDVVELGRYLVAKQPACAARTDGPCIDVLGVAPH